MATCPRCHAKQNYMSLLLFGDSNRLACKACGASLRVTVRQTWRVPYALVTGLVALILALSVVVSGDFVTTVALLLGWLLIALAVYPLVLVAREKQIARVAPRRGSAGPPHPFL